MRPSGVVASHGSAIVCASSRSGALHVRPPSRENVKPASRRHAPLAQEPGA
jgi:hypothetical protein